MTWNSSLTFSITAAALAMQQSVFLIRIGQSSRPDDILAEVLIDKSHSHTGTGPPTIKAYWHQALIWQSAVGLLGFSIGLWICGFVVFIWQQANMLQKDQTKWDQSVSCFRSDINAYLGKVWIPPFDTLEASSGRGHFVFLCHHCTFHIPLEPGSHLACLQVGTVHVRLQGQPQRYTTAPTLQAHSSALPHVQLELRQLFHPPTSLAKVTQVS